MTCPGVYVQYLLPRSIVRTVVGGPHLLGRFALHVPASTRPNDGAPAGFGPHITSLQKTGSGTCSTTSRDQPSHDQPTSLLSATIPPGIIITVTKPPTTPPRSIGAKPHISSSDSPPPSGAVYRLISRRDAETPFWIDTTTCVELAPTEAKSALVQYRRHSLGTSSLGDRLVGLLVRHRYPNAHGTDSEHILCVKVTIW